MNPSTEKTKKGEKSVHLGDLNEQFVAQDHLKNAQEFKRSNERHHGKVNELVELDSRTDDLAYAGAESVLLSIEQQKLKKYLYSARYINSLCLVYTVILMIIYFASIRNFEYAVYFFLFEAVQGLLFALSAYMTLSYTVCNRFISPVSSLFIIVLIIIVVVVQEPAWKILYSIMILVSTIANFLTYCIIALEYKMETEDIIKTRLYMKRNRIF